MQRSHLRIGFYLLLVFVSGVLVGAFGHQFYTVRSVSAKAAPGQDELRRKYVEKLKARLQLEQPQVHRVTAILDETREDYRQFRANHQTELKAIQDGQVSKIRQILTPPQLQAYQTLLDEQERERQASEKKASSPSR